MLALKNMEWFLLLLIAFLAWGLPHAAKLNETERAKAKHRAWLDEVASKFKAGLEGKSTIQNLGNTEVAKLTYSGSFEFTISKNGEPEDKRPFKTIYELDNHLTNCTRFKVSDFI